MAKNKVSTSKPRLRSSGKLGQSKRQLHGIGPDAMAGFHVHGSEVPSMVIPARILIGDPRRDVVVHIHHPGSSFDDGGQPTIGIPKDGIGETEGLSHNQEISPLTSIKPPGN